MKKTKPLLWWSLLVSVFVTTTDASFRVPDLPMSDYTMAGDLNLGGIFRIHEHSSLELCSSTVHSQKLFQYAEAMVHAVHYANSLPHVLPNVTLGFTILDSCTKDQVRSLLAKTFPRNFSGCQHCWLKLIVYLSRSHVALHFDLIQQSSYESTLI